jgi:hypothetical protein
MLEGAEGQQSSENETFGPIRFDFAIGDKQFNILDALDKRDLRFGVPVDAMKPGDGAAQYLLRTFESMHVTRREYLGTMGRLLEYAAKKEGGYDADFIATYLHLVDKTQEKMGMPHTLEGDPYRLNEEQRMIFFSRVYGQMEAIRENIWNDPSMENKKKQIVSNAKAALPLNLADTFK